MEPEAYPQVVKYFPEVLLAEPADILYKNAISMFLYSFVIRTAWASNHETVEGIIGKFQNEVLVPLISLIFVDSINVMISLKVVITF